MYATRYFGPLARKIRAPLLSQPYPTIIIPPSAVQYSALQGCCFLSGEQWANSTAYRLWDSVKQQQQQHSSYDTTDNNKQ